MITHPFLLSTAAAANNNLVLTFLSETETLKVLLTPQSEKDKALLYYLAFMQAPLTSLLNKNITISKVTFPYLSLQKEVNPC